MDRMRNSDPRMRMTQVEDYFSNRRRGRDFTGNWVTDGKGSWIRSILLKNRQTNNLELHLCRWRLRLRLPGHTKQKREREKDVLPFILFPFLFLCVCVLLFIRLSLSRFSFFLSWPSLKAFLSLSSVAPSLNNLRALRFWTDWSQLQFSFRLAFKPLSPSLSFHSIRRIQSCRYKLC